MEREQSTDGHDGHSHSTPLTPPGTPGSPGTGTPGTGTPGTGTPGSGTPGSGCFRGAGGFVCWVERRMAGGLGWPGEAVGGAQRRRAVGTRMPPRRGGAPAHETQGRKETLGDDAPEWGSSGKDRSARGNWMSQAVNPLETARAYAPPSVTQFSVFLDNRVGKLLDVVEAIDSEPGVRIVGIAVHEASDHAVVRLITNSADATRDLLRKRSFAFSEMSLLVVELVNGHTLESMCLCLLAAELNIRFAYALMLRPNGTPTIALAVDDPTLAGQVLRKKNFRLLGEADLPGAR